MHKNFCWTFHIQGRILTSGTKQFSPSTWPFDLEQVHPAPMSCLAISYLPLDPKGTTSNDLGVGPEEIEKKNFGGPSPGKNKF